MCFIKLRVIKIKLSGTLVDMLNGRSSDRDIKIHGQAERLGTSI